MISSAIGQYSLYALGLSSNLFKKEGLDPFESVFYHPFEDFAFLLGLKIIYE